MASNVDSPNTPGLYDDVSPLIRRTDIAMVCLSAVFLCGRLYARRLSNARFWWDDYLIIAGLVLAWGSSFVVLEMVKAGLGTHTQAAVARDPHILTRYLQRLFAIEIFYSTCLPVIKCSVLLFYWRIFTTREFKIAVYMMGTFIVCWFLATILVSIFGCIPVKAAWDPTVAGARCINADSFFIGNAALNIFGDLALLCMPMPMVWTLHLARSKKIALTAVFLLGGLALASSIIRTIYLITAAKAGPDILWNEANLGLWTTVELNIGVVAACLPAMQSLLSPVLKRFGTEHSGGSKPYGSGHKGPWTARSQGNEARNARSAPAPAGFCRLDDTERLPGKTPPVLPDALYMGAGNSTTTNDSFYRQDSGGIDQDAVPLNAIHVKKVVSVSDA